MGCTPKNHSAGFNVIRCQMSTILTDLCACAYVRVPMCAHTWRSEVNLRFHSLKTVPPTPRFCEALALTGLWAH